MALWLSLLGTSALSRCQSSAGLENSDNIQADLLRAPRPGSAETPQVGVWPAVRTQEGRLLVSRSGGVFSFKL